MTINAILLPKYDKTLNLFSLSVHKLKMFYECAGKYKFCYKDKLPRVEKDFLVFGKFLHLVFETFHRKIMDDPNLSNDWENVLQDSWNIAFKEYEKDLIKEQKPDEANLIEEAQKIVNIYKDNLLKEGLPNVIAVEKLFYINIDNKILVQGAIDRIQLDPDGILHVVDYKTTKDVKYLKDYFQLMTYCYSLIIEDESIQKIRASFLALKNNCALLTKEFSRDDILEIAEKFIKCFYDIEDEKLFRPNPNFLCMFCDYLDHCPQGMKFIKKFEKGREILKEKGLLNKKPVTGIREW